MKNRKTIIVAFVLVACMIVGVGYALVVDTLDIGGSADVSQKDAEEAFNQQIYFDGVVVETDEGTKVVGNTTSLGVKAPAGYTANINDNNNDKAQFTVTGLSSANQYVEIVFRVVNNGDLNADLKMVSSNNSNPGYFTVEYWYYDVANSQYVAIDVSNTTDEFYTLPAKTGDVASHVDIKVKVTLKETPTSHQSLTTSFEFNAESDDTVGTP